MPVSHRGEGEADLSRGAIVELAEAASAASKALGLRDSQCPWMEPLPTSLSLADLPPAALPGAATIGILDDPDHQRQLPFAWSPAVGSVLLYGATGSGATAALQTVAVSLSRMTNPADLHIYALDFGHQSLAGLVRLPHVGAVIGAHERERQERLLRFLRTELERRRSRVAAESSGRRDEPVRVALAVAARSG